MPYPTPPGTRIAYDTDGSVVLIRDYAAGSWYEVTSEERRLMCAERGDGIGIGIAGFYNETSDTFGWGGAANGLNRSIVVLLPQATLLSGVSPYYSVLLYDSNGPNFPVVVRARTEVSVNSTNGDDGDWVTVLTQDPPTLTSPYSRYSKMATAKNFRSGNATKTIAAWNDGYRRARSEDDLGFITLSGSAVRNVKAVRLSVNLDVFGGYNIQGFAPRFQFFGHPDTESMEDRVDFWSSISDMRITPNSLDWGDVPLSSSDVRTFRIKNMSSSKTSSGLLLSAASGASTTSPAPHDFLMFSWDGISWSSTLSVASLSPTTITSIIHVRRVVPENAALSNWSPKITVSVEEWL